MKKLIFAIALCFCYTLGNAQIIISNESKITLQQTKSLAANVMASFTEKVSFAYKQGMSYDKFTANLYSAGTETPPIFIEGNHMLEEAFKYLSNGTSKAGILKSDDGKAVVAAMQVLYNQRLGNDISKNGSELFGGKNFSENSNVTGKAAGCRWYQFWCLTQAFVGFVVDHWDTVNQIICLFTTLC